MNYAITILFQCFRNVAVGTPGALPRHEGPERSQPDHRMHPGNEQIPHDAARPGQSHGAEESQGLHSHRHPGGEGIQVAFHARLRQPGRCAHPQCPDEQEPTGRGD